MVDTPQTPSFWRKKSTHLIGAVLGLSLLAAFLGNMLVEQTTRNREQARGVWDETLETTLQKMCVLGHRADKVRGTGSRDATSFDQLMEKPSDRLDGVGVAFRFDSYSMTTGPTSWWVCSAGRDRRHKTVDDICVGRTALGKPVAFWSPVANAMEEPDVDGRFIWSVHQDSVLPGSQRTPGLPAQWPDCKASAPKKKPWFGDD